jgi:hypothetical protein
MSEDLGERLVQYVIIGVLALGLIATSPVTVPLGCLGWLAVMILERAYPDVRKKKS